MGDAFLIDRPLFALEGGASRHEIELLAEEFAVGLFAVVRNCQLQFLGAAFAGLLDLKADRADGLRSVESESECLLAARFGDPTSAAGAAVSVKGVLHRMTGEFRGDQHGGNGIHIQPTGC